MEELGTAWVRELVSLAHVPLHDVALDLLGRVNHVTTDVFAGDDGNLAGGAEEGQGRALLRGQRPERSRVEEGDDLLTNQRRK